MLCYFNVRLFDNALVAVAIAPVTVVIVAQFDIAVFQYCTIWWWAALTLHYLMLHYFDDPLVVLALFDVALFYVVLLDVALCNVALFTVALFNVPLLHVAL